jgi:hypothetical protein
MSSSLEYSIKPLTAESAGKKQSNFLITINPNYIPKDAADAQEWGSKLESVVLDVFSKEDAKDWLKFLDGGDVGDIESIQGGFGVEIGKRAQGGRLHMHMYIEIVHETKLQINLTYIRSALAEGMSDFGIKSVYVNVRAVRGGEFSIRNYILKDL